MSVLLHLSDTHFGTEQAPVVEALVALAARLQPTLVVLSGDITQRATPAQFRAARAFTDRLGAPLLAIPGNHDIPLLDLHARLTQPYARYTNAFGATLEPVHASPHWLVVGVNTTRAWRHRNGEVSQAQIQRVAGLLAAAQPAQLRVVVVHQPVAVPQAGESRHLLRGHGEATRLWAQAGADLVLGGHIHLPYAWPLLGLVRRLCVVQAGTAVSARTRPGVPHSVNVLRWPAAGSDAAAWPPEVQHAAAVCQVEQWDFARQQGAFVQARATQWLPERAGHGD